MERLVGIPYRKHAYFPSRLRYAESLGGQAEQPHVVGHLYSVASVAKYLYHSRLRVEGGRYQLSRGQLSRWIFSISVQVRSHPGGSESQLTTKDTDEHSALGFFVPGGVAGQSEVRQFQVMFEAGRFLSSFG